MRSSYYWRSSNSRRSCCNTCKYCILEREQEGLRSLPGLLAESIGLTIEQIYDGNNKGELKFVELNEKIIKTARESIFAMVNSLKIVDGRVYLEKSLLSKLFDLLKVFGLNYLPLG